MNHSADENWFSLKIPVIFLQIAIFLPLSLTMNQKVIPGHSYSLAFHQSMKPIFVRLT
jgi:hypothetical protein